MTPQGASAAAAKLALQALAAQPITIATEPPGPRAREMIARALPHMSPSLIHCYPLMVRRASGCMVEDVDGNVFLDAEAGVATASTGHCHPAIAAAIAEQAEVLIHICGTDFHYPGYGAICEKLAQLARGIGPNQHQWQTFLTNSGTEAVEAALKLARNHTHRPNLIAFRGGFHGRTLGSLSLTASKSKYRKGFGPLLPNVYHAEYGSADSVEELFATVTAPEDVAAIVVEPVLGEGGYIVPPPDFLPRLRALCDRHGILLVFDEVQTGMGRTGKMFAAEHSGVVPDILLVAKGIASGMPLGAMMAPREKMTWPPGSHGSTIAGNPVSIAAGMATIKLLEGGLCANSARVGDALQTMLRTTLAGNANVTDVRGVGLMIGVELATPQLADAVANLCFRRGLLVLECGKKAIRMSPPLIITEEQARVTADVFAGACRDVEVRP
ncbi:MAG TPA: aminotransferase class III-fold pyridoxal phosphate-dependent enzyme [Polyangia bacterium]|jgi:4-aminobutyrate aminotransferase|nr:aminotransferase class III-fold pyridoxal phosphate-dependent enzyme [Polyangia bacterium]